LALLAAASASERRGCSANSAQGVRIVKTKHWRHWSRWDRNQRCPPSCAGEAWSGFEGALGIWVAKPKSSAAARSRTARLSCRMQLSSAAIGPTLLAINQMSNLRAIVSAFFLPTLRYALVAETDFCPSSSLMTSMLRVCS
jgi:hypothetical protein